MDPGSKRHTGSGAMAVSHTVNSIKRQSFSVRVDYLGVSEGGIRDTLSAPPRPLCTCRQTRHKATLNGHHGGLALVPELERVALWSIAKRSLRLTVWSVAVVWRYAVRPSNHSGCPSMKPSPRLSTVRYRAQLAAGVSLLQGFVRMCMPWIARRGMGAHWSAPWKPHAGEHLEPARRRDISAQIEPH
eukprot:3795594-Rhodomonas_salina.5